MIDTEITKTATLMPSWWKEDVLRSFDIWTALIALCFVYAGLASGQSPANSPQATEQIKAKIDSYMRTAVDADHFSGAVLVARDGQPIVSKAYGMANYELNVPNTPQTAFRLASITKQFTAAAIMQLQERGKLTVSDSICKHLDNCPAAWQPITIRHLLTHTSGIPNYTLFPGFYETTAVRSHTFVGFVDEFRDKPLEFEPGDRFAYSNSGYYLLGLIIERASGVPYADFLRDNIFKPLEMGSSGYDNSSTLVPNRANGYRWTGKSFVNAPYWHTSIAFSAGGLYSTTEDLLRWERSLSTEKILRKKSLDEIFTPFKNGFGHPFTEDAYGYGWGFRTSGRRQLIYHGGGISGFGNYIVRFPLERVTVIVLSNSGSTSSGTIANALSSIVFGEPYKPLRERKFITVIPQTLDKYVGQYQLAPDLIINITNEGGKLMFETTGYRKGELLAESETDFYLPRGGVEVVFIKDAQGLVTGLALQTRGERRPARKIE